MSPSRTLPTKREVIAELEREIAMYRDSHAVGGVMEDADVLHTIRCLDIALQIVKNRKGRAPRPSDAWAAVGKESGKVLRDGKGHYAIYTHCADAKADCPVYGEVKRVRVVVSK